MFQRLIDDVKEINRQRGADDIARGGRRRGAVHHHRRSCARPPSCSCSYRYGPIEACLAGAAVFFVVTAIAAGSYMARKRQIRVRAEQVAKNAERVAKTAAHSLLADPAMLAIALQVVRAVGIKRLVPILAIGGVALGLLAARGQAAPAEEPAE